ncbi:MAG: hypothetical protein KJ941_11615 [Bacteroidetes bacterium]|nr:hypothetical protein [Bacteroidota bacterium]
MGSSTVFYAIGDFMQDYAFLPLEWIGHKFNYFLIVVGFVGLFYWLNYQRKFNEAAKNNPDQLK